VFLPGKETAIALRKERWAYQLEDAVGKTEANKSKKRTAFSSTEMFTDLDLVVSYLANVINDSLQLRYEQEDQGLIMPA